MPPEPIKTSFIPKASLKVERRQEVKGAPVALASLIATIILILAVGGAAGIFLFKQYLINQINSKKESLDRARAAFQPDTIKELVRVDTRLQVGAALLGTHPSPSLLFDEIEARTLVSVRFNNFQFGAGTAGALTVSMNGTAKSFNAVALQSDAFGASEVLSNPIFSNMNFDQTGNVAFDVTASVNADRLRYLRGASIPVASSTAEENL
jgi:hypothetical protein